MRARTRRLGPLLLGCTLLAVACPRPAPPPPPPEAAPPAHGDNICERPARPAPAAQDPQLEASFRAFAQTWLEKMRQGGAATNAPGGRRQIRDEFETELQPTHSTLVPWVGILRYCEEALHCPGAGGASCQVSKSTAITEIFPFEAGKWRY